MATSLQAKWFCFQTLAQCHIDIFNDINTMHLRGLFIGSHLPGIQLIKRKMILRYRNESFYETKEPKLNHF
jgi:hypothetical protein